MNSVLKSFHSKYLGHTSAPKPFSHVCMHNQPRSLMLLRQFHSFGRHCLLLLALLAFDAANAQQPDLVVFISDDLGCLDTAPYGATDVRTPNMQRLAGEG